MRVGDLFDRRNFRPEYYSHHRSFCQGYYTVIFQGRVRDCVEEKKKERKKEKRRKKKKKNERRARSRKSATRQGMSYEYSLNKSSSSSFNAGALPCCTIRLPCLLIYHPPPSPPAFHPVRPIHLAVNYKTIDARLSNRFRPIN